jgi:hypothetical protein
MEAGVIENLMWIAIALAGAIWFFSILEGWSDIGNLDDNEPPEDP